MVEKCELYVWSFPICKKYELKTNNENRKIKKNKGFDNL